MIPTSGPSSRARSSTVLSIAMPNARFKKDLIPHFRTHLDAAAADIRAAQENPLP